MKVTVILTCFNRKEKTIRCITSIAEQNPEIEFQFVIVDDNSSDGTKAAIEATSCNSDIISGNGSLYWAGGMRTGIEKYLKTKPYAEYVLFVNDDVNFKGGIVSKLIEESIDKSQAVIVGATCDDTGKFTYGAMQLIIPRKRDLYKQIRPEDGTIECDTFNCNCVLLPDAVVRQAGNFDPAYTHSLADIDYGLKLRRMGVRIFSSEEYVGICYPNSNKGTWTDTSLSRGERLRKKESPKGAPTKQWFYFLRKNFGLITAIKGSITPFIRILLKK